MINTDLLSDECSVPAVHSEGPGAPPQGQTVCALGCVSWRTPRPGSDQYRGSEADWHALWTTPADWGWGAEGRASSRQMGWQHYTPHTLRSRKIGEMNKRIMTVCILFSAFTDYREAVTHRGSED